ncbi:MAG: hypothetical protein Q7R41_19335 [Phycisphaerales bacterium]|nr:hypothetical protein [Phycisphaerales bacterium]
MATMTEQVARIAPHLKVGGTYLFEHIRKGPFVGTFLGTKPTRDGDAADAEFFEVDVITEDGSGQENLANSYIRDDLNRKMRPPISRKLIRPSLLRTVTAPGQTSQKELLAHFDSLRAKAEDIAAESGTEPTYPVLSLPRESAMKHLTIIEDPAMAASVVNNSRALLYAGLAAAGAAIIAVAYFVMGG